MRIEEFLLEDRQVGVAEVELELQRVVGDTPAAAEQGEDLVEHGVKVSLHLSALLMSGYGPVCWPIIAEAWMRLHGGERGAREPGCKKRCQERAGSAQCTTATRSYNVKKPLTPH